MARLHLPLLLLLLVCALVLGALQLVAGVSLERSRDWLAQADAWERVLRTLGSATADPAFEDRSLLVTADEVRAELTGMTVAYPLPLRDVPEAAEALRVSHEVLAGTLDGVEKLGPLGSFEALAPAFQDAAAGVQALTRPAIEDLVAQARSTALLDLAHAVLTILAAALALVLLLRYRALAKSHGRLLRHVSALEGRP